MQNCTLRSFHLRFRMLQTHHYSTNWAKRPSHMRFRWVGGDLLSRRLATIVTSILKISGSIQQSWLRIFEA